MTAAYMTRCVYLTFYGEYRGGARTRTPTSRRRRGVEHDLVERRPRRRRLARRRRRRRTRPHESNRLITGPLWVLSFFAVFAGFFNFPHSRSSRSGSSPRGRVRPTSCTRRVQRDPRDDLGR